MNNLDEKLLAKANDIAASLLAQMTLDEKIQQLSFSAIANYTDENKHSADYVPHPEEHKDGLGGLWIPLYLTPVQLANWVNQAQTWFKENTRLGIPPIIFSESLHGVMTPQATVFPQAIALGSTFDPELLQQVASAISTEARCMGISQALAPDLDLARDPRWGRVEETYGEDSYLTARLGEAYVQGLQHPEGDLKNKAFSATLKHFTGHGCPESGVNLSPVCGSERELRQRYLPPFEAAIRAGALSVMPAYSEYDGIPCHSSHFMLTRILREEWSFEGYTFSDFGGIEMLANMHHAAADEDDAAIQAMNAGMDSEAPGVFGYGKNLKKLLADGKLSQATLDRAVTRILRVKALLGLFDNCRAEVEKVSSIVRAPEHLALARKAAEESVILLKNDGVLPFGSSVKKLAVIGPNADSQEPGDYTVDCSNMITLLQALRQRSGLEVHYAKGCDLVGSDRSGFEEARKAVLASDAAVIAVGGSSFKRYGVGWGVEKDGAITCGEGYDYADLDLCGVQEELILELAKLGKPIVVVLIDGRPSTICKVNEAANGLLCAWYPGDMGGCAISDILFGDVNPSGKLPITFPKSIGQLPMCYDHKPSARGYYHHPGTPENPGRDYVFLDTNPLYEFGHGLSYTTFRYSDLKATPVVDAEGTVEVQVTLTNTGSREGCETVQLYLHDLVSTVTTPVKRLCRFTRVNLAPGEQKVIRFSLKAEDLSFIGRDLKPTLEPGEFELLVGSQQARFRLV